MNFALMLISVALLLILVTWLLFLSIMTLQRARDADTLSTTARVFGTCILALGYLCDCLLNITIGSILFMELPREWLLSPRVARLQKGDPGYRQRVAAWICSNLLDPFDPSGCHCK